jgi:hypothetical protein
MLIKIIKTKALKMSFNNARMFQTGEVVDTATLPQGKGQRLLELGIGEEAEYGTKLVSAQDILEAKAKEKEEKKKADLKEKKKADLKEKKKADLEEKAKSLNPATENKAINPVVEDK